MSTATRSKGRGVRGGADGALEQLRSTVQTVRDLLSTKNGKRFIFALQFLLSFINLIYLKGVIRMAYDSLYYRLEIPESTKGTYCFLVSLACLGFGLLMLFTRRQIVTRLVIMCAMPFYLPIILFNYKHLCLLIPLGIMVVITYLASGTSEGPKTILGAVFLMLYILSAFVFLTVVNLMKPATEETVMERGITPNGQYRYSIVQVIDQGDGNTYVALEPNTCDIGYSHSKWYAKGYSKEIYRERPLGRFKTEWSIMSRADITRELITNNPNTTFTLNAEQMKLLGLDVGYAEEYTMDELSAQQRHKLGYGIEGDMVDTRLQKLLHLQMVDDEFSVTLTFDDMVKVGLEPTYEQRLSRMTDEDLSILGVPEENEVLTVNGKVVFRQYIAELQRDFWQSSRSFTAFLESNEVAPVVEGGLDLVEVRKRIAAEKAEKEAKNHPVTTETTTETTETTTETTETTEATTEATTVSTTAQMW